MSFVTHEVQRRRNDLSRARQPFLQLFFRDSGERKRDRKEFITLAKQEDLKKRNIIAYNIQLVKDIGKGWK